MNYKLSELDYCGDINMQDPVVLYVVQGSNDKKTSVNQVFGYVIDRLYADDEFFSRINDKVKAY